MMDVNYTSEKMLQGKMCLLDISVAGKNESIMNSFTLLYCCQTLLVTPYFLAPTLYCIERYMSRKTLFAVQETKVLLNSFLPCLVSDNPGN